MVGYYTVSQVARRYGVRPRDISDLFYNRELSDEKCPVLGGRRLIPPEYVPVIAAALRRHGLLPGPAAGPAQGLRTREIKGNRRLDEGSPPRGRGSTRRVLGYL